MFKSPAGSSPQDLKSLRVGWILTCLFCLSSCQPNLSDSTKEIGLTEGAGDAKIFGGEKVASTDSLSQSVFLLKYFSDNDQKYCSAIRILPHVLLTAAHCTSGDKIEAFANGEFFSKVKKVVVHPRYIERKNEIQKNKSWGEGNAFDLAILFLEDGHSDHHLGVLSTDFDSTPDIPLFTVSEKPVKAGDQLSIAGYGWQSMDALSGQKSGSLELQKTQMTVGKVSESNILEFDQTQKTGVCGGDSGGPAFTQEGLEGPRELRALAVSVYNPGQRSLCEGKSFFLAVAPLQDWIHSILNSEK